MSDLDPIPGTPPAEYERMGREARYNNRWPNPPICRDPADPRTLAYIEGYQSADYDIYRKGQ